MAIWLGYICGQALHMALRAQNIIRSSKSECDSVADIARKYGLEWLARLALATLGLVLWERYPALVNEVLGAVWIPAVPLMWATAFGYGLAADVLLDSAGERWTVLRRILHGNGNGGEGGRP